MSTLQFHRRFKEEHPVPHFCEQWNVHTFGPDGTQETYRVTFKLNRYEKPCYEVALETPSGAFSSLSRKRHYNRIQRVMGSLTDEYNDYKRNRNYQVKIN